MSMPTTPVATQHKREIGRLERHLDRLVELQDETWQQNYQDAPGFSPFDRRKIMERYEALGCAIALVRQCLP